MVENSLRFVPIEFPKDDNTLKDVVSNLQMNDAIEVELACVENQTQYDCIHSVLQECEEKYFVVSHEDIIGIISYKSVLENGYDIAILNVLTTNMVQKHPKDYYVAAKHFIASVATDHDALVCAILEGYDSCLKMAKKLGFQIVDERVTKGYKLLAHVLRTQRGKHGLDEQ